MKQKDKIRIYCHPNSQQNIQIGGWNVIEDNACVSVSVNCTNISIEFQESEMKILVFEEDEFGNIGDVLRTVKIPYRNTNIEQSSPEREKYMFIKDFFNLSKKEMIKPSPKQVRFFRNDKKNEKNTKHNRRKSS